ncbi:hypothetical protein R1flu_000393 [Riccia fluitans]|uniref:Uncharacterized protein n=1 Tax=Riccia fluitans TaxID=41844 RepID=A0ABD1Y0A7_9MARC
MVPPSFRGRQNSTDIQNTECDFGSSYLDLATPLRCARDLLRPVSRDVSRRRKRVLKKIAARLRHQNFATEKESDEEAHSAKEFFRIRVRRKLGAMGFQRDEKRRGGGATGGRAGDSKGGGGGATGGRAWD